MRSVGTRAGCAACPPHRTALLSLFDNASACPLLSLVSVVWQVSSSADHVRLELYFKHVREQLAVELKACFDVFVWHSEIEKDVARRVHARLHSQTETTPLRAFLGNETGQGWELREHALGHSSAVVLVFSQQDLESLTHLSTQASKGKDISRESSFSLIVELLMVLELLRRIAGSCK